MKKKTIIKLTITAVCSVGICIYAFWPQTYGNDRESIKKIILKQDRVQMRSDVFVFDIKDIENFRIAGFFEGYPDIDTMDASMGAAIFPKK